MTQVNQINSISVRFFILLLFIGSGFGQTNVRTDTDPSCTAACSCCLDTSPCTSSNDACGGQCIDGIFGGKCKSSCPTNCKRCTDHPDVSSTDSTLWNIGYCTECKDGYYSTSQSYQCQLECSVGGCQLCTSITDCTSCLDGYFKEGIECTRCKTGCDSCTSNNECTQCTGGYYNSGGPINSLNCVSCSSGCINQCDSVFGTCSCKSGFTGEKCDKCVDERYGGDCSQYCQSPCRTCTSRFDCTSCVSGYYWDGNNCQSCQTGCAQCSSSNDCTLCKDGYYSSGTECVDCSSGCSNMCDKVSGTCSCKPQYTGDKCDICIDGWHGPDCKSVCSSKCMDNKCDRGTGSCNSCPDGKYGDQCNLPCPPNCLQATCIQNTGACIGGCTSGYSGDMCCLKASNCKSCSSASQCSKCLPGKYGGTCDDECPANCADGICDKKNGTCNRCKNKFQGDKCTVAVATTGSTSGSSEAAIGWGVAGGLVIIIVVLVVLHIVYRRRLVKTSDCPNREADDVSTYINVTSVSADEAKETRKAVQDKKRQLQKYKQHQQKYQQKEAEYAEKVVRIQHELNVIEGPPETRVTEDGANSGTETQTYESLNQQEAGNHLYSDLGTK